MNYVFNATLALVFERRGKPNVTRRSWI